MSKFDSQLTDVTLSQLKVLLEQVELEVTLIALTGTQEIPSGALTFLRSSPRELMTSFPLSESAYGYIYILASEVTMVSICVTYRNGVGAASCGRSVTTGNARSRCNDRKEGKSDEGDAREHAV